MPRGHIFVATSSSSRLLVYLFLLSGKSRPPSRNRSFSFFAQSIGPGRYVFIPISSLNPPYISKRACLSPYFSAPAFPFLLFFSFTPSVLYQPHFSVDSTSSWSPLNPSMFSRLRCATYSSSPFCYFLPYSPYQLWLAASFLTQS